MAKTFRENLREELDYQDMTVKELSAETGIPKPTLDCYLSARQVIPPADIAVRIAEALNVSVEYLVTGEKKTKSGTDFMSAQQDEKSLLNDLNSIPGNIKEIIRTLIHQTAQMAKK